jgi:tellurite methyltransferase
MPLSDAHKWNQRYQEEKFKSFELPRPFLLENAGFLPGRGLAIDVAMGLGGNAGFLLERGLQVIGLDISQVAVYSAKSRYPELMTAIIDLTRAYFPPSKFDVILNFYYLQRDLWPIYKLALRPGGILIYETLTIAMLEQSEDIDPDNLLAPGELHTGFKDLQVLVYRESWMTDDRKHSRAVASLVARKTAC